MLLSVVIDQMQVLEAILTNIATFDAACQPSPRLLSICYLSHFLGVLISHATYMNVLNYL